MSAPRFNGTFELRNPALRSQEIPGDRRYIWTVAYEGKFPLAFAQICKLHKNKFLDKTRAVEQNFLLKMKNICLLNELIFKIMTLQRCLISLHGTDGPKVKPTVTKAKAHGQFWGLSRGCSAAPP